MPCEDSLPRGAPDGRAPPKWLPTVPVWEPCRAVSQNPEHFPRFLSRNRGSRAATLQGVTCHPLLPVRSTVRAAGITEPPRRAPAAAAQRAPAAAATATPP